MILNGLPWKQTEIILSFLRLHPSTAFQTLLLTMMATPFLLRDSCPHSDRMWSTGEGSGKPLQYSCLENPMNSMKRHTAPPRRAVILGRGVRVRLQRRERQGSAEEGRLEKEAKEAQIAQKQPQSRGAS